MVGKARSAFTLTQVTGARDDEKAWRIENPRDYVRLDMSKSSHGRKLDSPIVFKRTSVAVGNGSGVRAESAEALFPDSPAEALRLAGDTAPVLEIIDPAELLREAKPQVEGRAQRIAQIAADVVGAGNSATLAYTWEAIGARMRDEGLTRAHVRNAVCEEVTNALRTSRTAIGADGQTVRVVAEKGSGLRAPWRLSVLVTDKPGRSP
jgi:hypothetical protein